MPSTPGTMRTVSGLNQAYADNTSGQISAATARDFVETCRPRNAIVGLENPHTVSSPSSLEKILGDWRFGTSAVDGEDDVYGFSLSSGNIVYSGSVARRFHIQAALVLSHEGSGTKEVRVEIHQNDETVIASQTLPVSDGGATLFTLLGLRRLSNSGTISVHLINTTDSVDIDVEDATVSLIGLFGSE